MAIDLDLSDFIRAQLFPGTAAAVAIIRDGQIFYESVVGCANLEWNIPATKDTVFRIASLTKSFTAMATMMLVEDLDLDLDAAVRIYLPALPTHLSEVKLIHLLTHTSGLIEYLSVPNFWGQQSRRAVEIDEACEYFLHHPLQSQPGECYSYSNSGYILLGKIIETVAGVDYSDFLLNRILEPLGMKRTYYANVAPIIPGRASGYSRSAEDLLNAPFMSMTWPHASGGLGSTLDDMITWDAALTAKRLLSEPSYRRMIEPAVLADGSRAPYGMGWQLGEYAGIRCIYHSGSINGFSSYHLRMLDVGVSIIFLSNVGNLSTTNIVLTIANLVLGLDPLQPNAAEKILKFERF